MASKKAAAHTAQTWEEDDKKYPRKKDICNCCKQKDEVKLSYDLHNYICINMHACMLRFAKRNAERKM